jgi:glutaredoxin
MDENDASVCPSSFESASSRKLKLIIGRSSCPWTQRALALKWHDKSIMVDRCRTGQTLREQATQKTGHRTVPLVFDGNQFIGGCSELEQYIKK